MTKPEIEILWQAPEGVQILGMIEFNGNIIFCTTNGVFCINSKMEIRETKPEFTL
jgi:hypothetical protein